MKTCPHCKEEVEDNFDICWNCQYSFMDHKVLKENSIGLVCPACKAEIDPQLKFCPYCKFDLKSNISIDRHDVPGPVQQIDCYRCKVPMSYNGNSVSRRNPDGRFR